jgi:hypothetical protein
MLSCQQRVQQYAQCINIGCCGDCASCHLLGRSELGSQGPAPFDRGHRRVTWSSVIRKQLGDAKVQQLYFAVGPDQNVGWFNVAMDNQVGMGVGHSAEHINEQTDARFYAEPVVVAVFINALSLDMLENEIWFAFRSDTGIDQFRDMWMPELTKYSAFADKALQAAACRNRKMQKLDCYPPLEAAVTALRQPYAPHPALADGRDQRISADRLAGCRGFRQRERLPFQELLPGGCALLFQKFPDRINQIRPVYAQ